jgi:hypothetical protein
VCFHLSNSCGDTFRGVLSELSSSGWSAARRVGFWATREAEGRRVFSSAPAAGSCCGERATRRVPTADRTDRSKFVLVIKATTFAVLRAGWLEQGGTPARDRFVCEISTFRPQAVRLLPCHGTAARPQVDRCNRSQSSCILAGGSPRALLEST